MTVCLGLIMGALTVVSIALGIAGIALSSKVIKQDESNDQEIQAARIILDALESWNQPLPTSV